MRCHSGSGVVTLHRMYHHWQGSMLGLVRVICTLFVWSCSACPEQPTADSPIITTEHQLHAAVNDSSIPCIWLAGTIQVTRSVEVRRSVHIGSTGDERAVLSGTHLPQRRTNFGDVSPNEVGRMMIVGRVSKLNLVQLNVTECWHA